MEYDYNLSAEDFGLSADNKRTVAQAKRMNLALNNWLSHPTWSDRQVAEASGIDVITFHRYKQNEAFMQHYDAACRVYFRSLQQKALEALNRRIAKDDMAAVKYALDGNQYAAAQKIDMNADLGITINITDDN